MVASRRVLTTLLFTGAMLTGASMGQAQGLLPDLGVRFRIGYGTSPSFDTSAGSKTLSGPEFAVSFPIGTWYGQSLRLEPSYFGAGRLSSGDDADSDVTRFVVYTERSFLRFRGRIGLGYAYASEARGGEFGATSALLVDLGGSVPLGLSPNAPYADIHAIIATQSRLSGVFFGLGFKL